MFNLKNRDGLVDPKDVAKAGLKPALYEPPTAASRPAAGGVGARPLAPSTSPHRENLPGAALVHREEHAPAPTPHHPIASQAEKTSGSRLSVGVNIKLKGMEISDCDVLVIEGHVEATVNSKAMQIAEPGTLTGTALIDIAEIHGVFTGELTARSRLVVHGTGRVSGTIRYGQLIVAEGGEVSGDVKPLDEAAKSATPSRPASPDPRHAPAHPRGTNGD